MKKVLYVLGGVLLLGVLGFAYYAISPLFRNVMVDEALPEARVLVDQKGEAPIAKAEVVGTTGHPASGTARILEADGTTYVRYENFKTLNGPDIYVYLAKDLEAKEFVDLGKVRATEGNINYEIPPGTAIDDYPYVLTWCKTFGVLFNYAKLPSR